MSVWVGRAVAALVAVIALAIVFAYSLPRQVTVGRAMVVDSSSATIFALVGDLRAFGQLSPWLSGDDDAIITFTGPLDGVGQAMDWQSSAGAGTQTLTWIEPGRLVEWSVAVVGRRPAEMRIALESSDGSTTVTWSVEFDLGANPIGRYRGQLLDRTFGPDLERGLLRLRTLVESAPTVG